MPTNRMQSSDDLDFFNGKNKGNNQSVTSNVKKVEFGKFKQIAVGAIAVLSLTSLGVGGMYAWENHQRAKVEEVEKHISQMEPTSLFSLMDKEKQALQKNYLVNKALFEQYNNHKEMLDVLNDSNVSTQKINKNGTIYSNGIASLESDHKAIEKVISATAPGVSFETKKEVLLGSAEIATFNKWESALSNNTFVYAGALLSLNKETKNHLAFLEDTRKEIVNTVKEKIATKDYNLNATESALAMKVSKDLNAEISELEQVKRELRGTDQEHLLTNSDLNEAKEAVNNLQSEAVSQISQDKAQVQSLLAGAASASSNWDDSTISNGNTAANLNANYNSNNNQKDSGWGFFEYYLLYNWLAGGSSSRPSAMASFNSSSHYNSVQSNLYSRSSSRYNIKDSNSYLNRVLSGNYVDNSNSRYKTTKNMQNNQAFNNTSTPNTLAKGLMPANDKIGKAQFNKVQLGSLDKFKVLKAKKFDINELRTKIKKIHTKANDAKKEHKVAVERKARAEAKRREALAAKSSSSSVSGFNKYSSSSRRSGSSKSRR